MDNSKITEFERICYEFVVDNLPDRKDIFVIVSDVELVSQTMVDHKTQDSLSISEKPPPIGGNRNLEVEDQPELLIELAISGKVNPPNADVSFSSDVLQGFINNFTDFSHELSKSDPFFNPMVLSLTTSKGMRIKEEIVETPLWKHVLAIVFITLGLSFLLIVVAYVFYRRKINMMNTQRRNSRIIAAGSRRQMIRGINADSFSNSSSDMPSIDLRVSDISESYDGTESVQSSQASAQSPTDIFKRVADEAYKVRKKTLPIREQHLFHLTS